MRPIDTPLGKVYIPINKVMSDGIAASSDSEELWEECSQEEQARGDCESFYVYEDGERGDDQGIGSMTDEEIAELAELRLRHAEHTARLLTDSRTQQTSVICSPSIEERLSAIEQTLSQLLEEVKAVRVWLATRTLYLSSMHID